MTDLIGRLREVIDEHGKRDCDDDGVASCRCGATQLDDHSGHVAQEIVNRLGLTRQRAEDARSAITEKVRYVSALFDEELTVLEGAE